MSKHTPKLDVKYVGYNPQTAQLTFVVPSDWNGGAPPLKTGRLIAAAPDGLSVAKDALVWWHSVPRHFLSEEPAWVQAARDFITQATGLSPAAAIAKASQD